MLDFSTCSQYSKFGIGSSVPSPVTLKNLIVAVFSGFAFANATEKVSLPVAELLSFAV